MGANIFGSFFKVMTFGESHGPAMGALVDGCPAGVPFLEKLLLKRLGQRQPGLYPWLSARLEPDKPELLSGVFEGKTLGTPIAFVVRNTSARSKDYRTIKTTPRAGHADDVWLDKFGHADHRGGGRSSGRETIGRVLGGAVAEMFLTYLYPKLKVMAFPTQIGPWVRRDKPLAKDPESHNWFGAQTKEVQQFLIQKKKEGLSYGGVLQLRIITPPKGLGQPVFKKLKSDLSSAFMGIGACYAVSLGQEETHPTGETYSTGETYPTKSPPSTKSLHLTEGSDLHGQKDPAVYGGIRGGISTGEDIIFHLKFKPPASVLDVAKKGRHDPCILPRVAPVARAMAHLVLADHILWQRQDRA